MLPSVGCRMMPIATLLADPSIPMAIMANNQLRIQLTQILPYTNLGNVSKFGFTGMIHLDIPQFGNLCPGGYLGAYIIHEHLQGSCLSGQP